MTTKTHPRQQVQQALDEAGSVMDAAERLEQWAHKDRALYDFLTAPWLARAAYDAVRKVSQDTRKGIWTAPNYEPSAGGDRVRAHARTLLDFPLPDGTPLREATRAKLVQAVSFYREQSEDMAHKARWLDRVAQRTGRKKVGNALTLSELEQLKVEAGEPTTT